jgi:hypothetical protein
MTTNGTRGYGRMSGLRNVWKSAPMLHISSVRLGQSCPRQNPSPTQSGNAPNALGEPISIREAAEIIGCSVWAIRQRYLPQGLPCLRSGPMGKLIFYRHQVIRWILQQQNKQQKGGR